jgi:hypothetical protein
MNSKRGSSAVFLMVILAALISITLSLIYGIREECVKSRTDGIMSLAGDSVMSEYNYHIQDEYGLFFLKGNDRQMEEKLMEYVKYSINDMRAVKVESINVSGSRFSAANIDLIKDQILEYMELASAEGRSDVRRSDTEKERSDEISENRILKHGPTAVSLPSAAIPDKSLTSTAESAADNIKEIKNVFKKGTDTYMINQYILKHFNNKNKTISHQHFFRNEAEYILGGELSDGKNEKRVDMALKAMRFPLNLAHIYSDPEKRAETFALAEVMTPGAAAPATQAALAATWAYAESDNDVELLWQGYKVPVNKDKTIWAINLDNAVEGLTGGTIKPDANKGYDYNQYLQILLFFKDENVKISRILDLIQINTRMIYDGDFLINEHSVGITIEAEVNGTYYGYEKKY